MRRPRPFHTVSKLDHRLFRAVARAHTPWLDRALPALSRAANYSRLWLALAALLYVTGGRRGKRAAVRGVVSIVVNSVLVNFGVKRAVRRRRPDLRDVPHKRRLRKQPLTTSFPSGHAASAAAFAVGASQEMPRVAVPLGSLAAAVAYSRVYVGVHYPLDVLVGAMCGAGVALGSRIAWPVLPPRAEREPPADELLRLEPISDGEGVEIVVNPGSGPKILGWSLDDVREALPRAVVRHVQTPEELEPALREAASRCRVLGVAGGDGTVCTGATVAVEKDLPLLLVPRGTLNHFARDLRIETFSDSLRALERGEGARVDLGVIAEGHFINTAGLGGYPAMLEHRQKLQKRIGRWPAQVLAFTRAVRHDPIAVTVDGEHRKLWMIFIGNCRHEPAGFAPSWRPRLDDGLLDVRMLSAEHRFARTRVLLSVLTGRLAHSVAFERLLRAELRIESNRSELTIAKDGDPFDGPPAFTVGKLRRALTVYAPHQEAGWPGQNGHSSKWKQRPVSSSRMIQMSR